MQDAIDVTFAKKLESAFETYRPGDVRLVEEVRLLLSARRDLLVKDLEGDGLALSRRLAASVDLLLTAWLESASGGEGLTLVALGGYGRGELNPHSDVDVMVLYPEGAEGRARDLTGPLLAFLWDVGHVVGHSTRTVEKCREAMEFDLPTATALLEGRLVAGSRALYRRFLTEVSEPWLASNAEEFIEQKIAEARARHDFYGGSPLLSIPNVKESAGGLRDMHVAGWIAMALSGRKDFGVFREAGILSEEGTTDLLRAYADVHRVRNALHTVAGVRQDALDHAARREVAESLGFTDGDGFSGAERFMRRYYRSAVPLYRFLMRVIGLRQGRPVGEERRSLPLGLVEVGGEVYPVEDVATPGRALEAARLLVERGLAPSPELGDALAQAAEGVDDAFRSDPEAARGFLGLLLMPGAGPGLRALERAGFLAEYLPEFGRLSCLSWEDPHHQFTVDEHTLRAVESLDEICSASELEEELARVLRPDLLRLAILLHDIGKARGRNHIALGAAMVPEATRRLGLTEDEARLVLFLVSDHARMTDLIERRAPEEAADALALAVPDRSRLRCLYLLTLADVHATGAGALSGWREAQIRSLYEAALARLSPRPAETCESLVIAMAGEERREEALAHLEGMGPRYALEVEPSRAVLHLDLVRRLAEEPAALAYLAAPAYGEVWVGAKDVRGLFARIVGVLTLHDLDIGAARAYTRADGVALDGFFVTREGEAPTDDEGFWKGVTGDLTRAVTGDLDLGERLGSRRRRFRPGGEPVPLGRPAGATASNRISDRFTVVELTARDRLGVLHDLADLLYRRGLSIHHAIIATRGPLVLDTFYVTLADGRRLEEDDLAPLIQELEELVEEDENA